VTFLFPNLLRLVQRGVRLHLSGEWPRISRPLGRGLDKRDEAGGVAPVEGVAGARSEATGVGPSLTV
jgi:hypothetical protein